MKTKMKNRVEKKKWERIQIEPLIRDDGTISNTYFWGSDGEEHFQYVDRTGYIIREASKMDTEEWFAELENTDHTYDNMPAQSRMIVKACFSSEAENGIGYEKEKKVMLIYNPANELMGIMKLTMEDNVNAKIDLSVKNQWIIDAKKDKIMAVIKRMWLETLLYDRMYIFNAEGDKKIYLDSDEIAS